MKNRLVAAVAATTMITLNACGGIPDRPPGTKSISVNVEATPSGIQASFAPSAAMPPLGGGSIAVVNEDNGQVTEENLDSTSGQVFVEVDPGTYTVRLSLKDTSDRPYCTIDPLVETSIVVSPNSVTSVRMTCVIAVYDDAPPDDDPSGIDIGVDYVDGNGGGDGGGAGPVPDGPLPVAPTTHAQEISWAHSDGTGCGQIGLWVEENEYHPSTGYLNNRLEAWDLCDVDAHGIAWIVTQGSTNTISWGTGAYPAGDLTGAAGSVPFLVAQVFLPAESAHCQLRIGYDEILADGGLWDRFQLVAVEPGSWATLVFDPNARQVLSGSRPNDPNPELTGTGRASPWIQLVSPISSNEPCTAGIAGIRFATVPPPSGQQGPFTLDLEVENCGSVCTLWHNVADNWAWGSHGAPDQIVDSTSIWRIADDLSPFVGSTRAITVEGVPGSSAGWLVDGATANWRLPQVFARAYYVVRDAAGNEVDRELLTCDFVSALSNGPGFRIDVGIDADGTSPKGTWTGTCYEAP